MWSDYIDRNIQGFMTKEEGLWGCIQWWCNSVVLIKDSVGRVDQSLVDSKHYVESVEILEDIHKKNWNM